jgi:hypothetical protein
MIHVAAENDVLVFEIRIRSGDDSHHIVGDVVLELFAIQGDRIVSLDRRLQTGGLRLHLLVADIAAHLIEDGREFVQRLLRVAPHGVTEGPIVNIRDE